MPRNELCLGVLFGAAGLIAVMHRLNESETLWWRWASSLTPRHRPLKERAAPLSCVSFGARRSRPHRGALVMQWARRRLRHITFGPRCDGEGWVEYRRRRRALRGRSCGSGLGQGERGCPLLAVARHPEVLLAFWRGPCWWRTVAEGGPVDAPHPRKTWTCPAEAAILPRAGDTVHSAAMAMPKEHDTLAVEALYLNGRLSKLLCRVVLRFGSGPSLRHRAGVHETPPGAQGPFEEAPTSF